MANEVLEEQEVPSGPVLEIPVLYGGEWGPDLDFVASHNQISTAEVIALHTAPEYLVYMIGFAPGFPYLGGMNGIDFCPKKRYTKNEACWPDRLASQGSKQGSIPLKPREDGRSLAEVH
jgi:KipI family sensor histidine kinase inhibitor